MMKYLPQNNNPIGLHFATMNVFHLPNISKLMIDPYIFSFFYILCIAYICAYICGSDLTFVEFFSNFDDSINVSIAIF